MSRLLENPKTALYEFRRMLVMEGAQRQAGFSPAPRVRADPAKQPATFLILGPASSNLSRQVYESLTGPAQVNGMLGWDLSQLFPRHRRNSGHAVDTLVLFWRWMQERCDLAEELQPHRFGPRFGRSPARVGRIGWMWAHSHGLRWNGSKFAGGLGGAPNTPPSCLDALEQTL